MTTNSTGAAAALADLDAKYAAARAKLARELAIGEQAATAPHRVQETSSGLPTWLHYKARTLADALAIMAAAAIVPAYAYKGTFTRIQPEALATDKSGEVIAGPFAASFKVDHGAGYGPTAELRFFVMAGEHLCEAHVSIEPERGLAHHWQWGAAFVADPRGRAKRGEGREQIRGEYRANNNLVAMSDHHIKWSTGGDDGASFQYFWAADTVEGGSEHAVAQLATIAGER